MDNWKALFSPATPAQVARLETKCGMPLPPKYRSFLLSRNGGRPEAQSLFLLPEVNESVMLGILYGIADDGGSLNIETLLAEMADELPSGSIPIGEDPGGNLLLLATEGVQKETILFWDWGGVLAKRLGKSVFYVAETIDDLLGSLRPVPTDR